MAKFKYQAITPSGSLDSGVLTATTRDEALNELKRRQLRVKKLETANALSQDFKFHNPWPNGKDMSLFCSAYAMMASGQVAQNQILSSLIRTTDNQKFKEVLRDVADRVNRGQDIVEAMRRYPQVFDRSFLALFRAAYMTNTVPQTFNRLSMMYERNVKVAQEVRGALVQPSITLAIAVVVVLILSYFVVPQFKGMLEGLNVPLPTITKVLISTTDVMRSPLGLLVLAAFVVAGFVINNYIKTKKGKEAFDRFVLKIPKVGELIRLGALSRVNRTLATLLGNGVRKDEALGIAAQASGNIVLETILLEAQKSVERGELIYPVLERYPKLFPANITGMIATGEDQGELALMLDRVSDFYESKVESDAKNLTKFLEPVMFVFLGFIVGGIVMAILMPLSSLIQNFSH